MAAYAALVSLSNDIKQIRNHPRLSTSFDSEQMESLLQRLDFFLDFIQSYNISYGGSKEEAGDLERQIASVAHSAEDVIEYYIVDQIDVRRSKITQVRLGHGKISPRSGRQIASVPHVAKDFIEYHIVDLFLAESNSPLVRDLRNIIQGTGWDIVSMADAADEDVIESHTVDPISKYNRVRLSKPEISPHTVAHVTEGFNESRIVDLILVGSNFQHTMLNLRKIIQDSEWQIVSVLHAAENVFKSDQTDVLRSKFHRLMLNLWKIIQDMDSVKEKVLKVHEERGFKAELPESPIPMSAASSRTPTAGKSNMVGFDDYLIRLLDQLTGHQPDQKIIPITGMGGIGKTTLARNAYDSLLVVQHFDVRAWVTISEGYNVRKILLEALSCMRKSNDRLDEKTEGELGEQLHKTLFGRRYLMVLDDMWSIDAWEKINRFFPDNYNGSRIIVTTRIVKVANDFGTMGLALDFLDDDLSWKLFCDNVFPQEVCPPRLVESGKKIVKKCKGLPLAIVVVGGLLGNSPRTQDQWEKVEKDIKSVLSTAEDNRCLSLLSLSYSHLPARLKPCFLYLGIFLEDELIRVSRLTKLWVAEGLIKPNKDQSLEEIAESYIKDLVDRNLIFVDSFRWNGKVKTFCIHDLLREMSIWAAEKEKFLCFTIKSELDTPRKLDTQRRAVFREIKDYSLISNPLFRSLIFKQGRGVHVKSRLLRVLVGVYGEPICINFQQVNMRFLAQEGLGIPCHLPSSISSLWNVQTLIMTRGGEIVAPSQIWKLTQLRHLKFRYLTLPDPLPSDASVLHNLQTLGKVANFKFSKEACDRLPNIEKLHVYYGDFSRGAETCSYYCIHNFALFNNLESLHIVFGQKPNRDDLLRSLVFPNSLKKLTMDTCQLEWNDMSIFGLLPHLEALKLRFSVSGPNWDPVEGEFLRLRYLQIYFSNLICWNADSAHFPVLENLVLERCHNLEEIPLGIGDIPTLKHICLVDCRISATLSAIRILEEQESMGNVVLNVKVNFRLKPNFKMFMEQVNLEGLTGVKFQIKDV